MKFLPILACIIDLAFGHTTVASDEDAVIFWVNEPGLRLNSIEYDDVNGLYCSSMANGTIYKMLDNDEDITLEPFFGHANLSASNGFKIDFTSNIMYIAHAQPDILYDALTGAGGAASSYGKFMSGIMKVDISDTSNPTYLFDSDMSMYNYNSKNATYHFLRDVTIDSNGNAYTADCLAGIVYKISSDNQITIFSYRDDWIADLEALTGCPFGIDIHPSEEFLVINTNFDSLLWKIPINNAMDGAKIIEYSNVEEFQSEGFEGLKFDTSGEFLYVSHTGANQVFQFTTTNTSDWSTVQLNDITMTRYDKPGSISLVTASEETKNTTQSINMWVINEVDWYASAAVRYPVQQLSFYGAESTSCDNSNSGSSGSGSDNDSNSSENSGESENTVGLIIAIIASVIFLIVAIVAIIQCLKYKSQAEMVHANGYTAMSD